MTPEESEAVKRDAVKGSFSKGEDVEKLKRDLKRSELIMVGIIVVLFVGFFGGAIALGGIVVDAFRSREASYQDLVNKVDEQQADINNLIITFNEQRELQQVNSSTSTATSTPISTSTTKQGGE